MNKQNKQTNNQISSYFLNRNLFCFLTLTNSSSSSLLKVFLQRGFLFQWPKVAAVNIISVLFFISETELSNNGRKSLISLVVLRETWNKFSYTNSKGNKQTNTNFLGSWWQYKQESWWWKGIIQSLHPDLDSMNVVVVVVYARVVQIFCLSKWMNEIPFRFSFINIVVVVVNISIYQVKGGEEGEKFFFPIVENTHTYTQINEMNF